MNRITEMSDLWNSRPGTGASNAETAEWYGKKSKLHNALAASVDGAERADERNYADLAASHADRLLGNT